MVRPSSASRSPANSGITATASRQPRVGRWSRRRFVTPSARHHRRNRPTSSSPEANSSESPISTAPNGQSASARQSDQTGRGTPNSRGLITPSSSLSKRSKTILTRRALVRCPRMLAYSLGSSTPSESRSAIRKLSIRDGFPAFAPPRDSRNSRRSTKPSKFLSERSKRYCDFTSLILTACVTKNSARLSRLSLSISARMNFPSMIRLLAEATKGTKSRVVMRNFFMIPFISERQTKFQAGAVKGWTR